MLNRAQITSGPKWRWARVQFHTGFESWLRRNKVRSPPCRRGSASMNPSYFIWPAKAGQATRCQGTCTKNPTTLESGSCDGSHCTRTCCSIMRTTKRNDRQEWRCWKDATANDKSHLRTKTRTAVNRWVYCTARCFRGVECKFELTSFVCA